jgi:ketosteroid isomerase-like protein/cytochrome c553
MESVTKHIITVAATLGVLAVGAGLFVYSGIYDSGADSPHWPATYALMQQTRERSIEHHAKGIALPGNLGEEAVILKGAGQYAAMCTGCHLKPGMKDSEIRPGLYPQPPNLSQVRVDPKDAFWVIKHGLKMSAMPAWGMSHDDATIWSMVAFLQKLPDLTPAQYKDMVAKAPPDEDMDMGEEGGDHHHGSGEADEGGHSDNHGGSKAAASGPGESAANDQGHSHDQSAVAESDGHDHAAAAETPLSLDGLELKAVPAAEAVAESFHAALQKGDRDAVLALLAPEVTISEGGHTQSRDDYASRHLSEDIAFLKSARIKPVSLASMPMGETAMVGSETLITATLKGKPTTLRSREMLTLKRQGPQWKIMGVRWQSAPAENGHSD